MSGGAFLIALIASMMAQINHIDLCSREVIYEYPLKLKFALPIAFTMGMSLMGITFMGAFAFLNW